MARRHRLDIFAPSLPTSPLTFKVVQKWLEWERDDSGLNPVRPAQCYPVFSCSPLSTRKALERIARYFQREMEYDFLQYAYDEDEDARDVGFLWADGLGEERAIGGCVFRWREWTNAPHGYGLAWVWFHPYFRARHSWERSSLFADAWPMFRKRFGDFCIEPPISKAMLGFLRKVGERIDEYGNLAPRDASGAECQ